MATSIKTKNIHHEVTFKASPEAVYEALMDSKKHSAFTGAPAKIATKVSGAFTIFGDMGSGFNLELVPDKKIVQAWRMSDWPQSQYSVVYFVLAKAGKGTKLVFDHTGVPEKSYKGINEGWRTHYWQPMKKFLEK